jgi:N-acetylmuramoyl-L-alanine amidase
MTEPYPAAQIGALCQLLAQLRQEFPNLREIAGHEELDTAMVPASDAPDQQVRRKLDPGPQFPWGAVLRDSGLIRHDAG